MARTFQPAQCFDGTPNSLPSLHVLITVPIDTPSSYENEQYTLDAAEGSGVSITAESPQGARNAMATLSQLIAKTENGCVMSKQVHIFDAPAKPYRGIMVDTSRHFLPLRVLKRIVKGMGMAKLNVLHLHLTDAQSFPLLIPSHPQFAEDGATSPEEVYTPEDVKELLDWAELHGVVLLPEIDAPAHVGKGWPRDMLVCYEGWENGGWAGRAVEPPSGQLNIANEAVYDVFKDIYSHLKGTFTQTNMIHLGGDEVVIGDEERAWAKCWNSSLAQPILDLLESKGLDRRDPASFYQLWGEFTKRSISLARSTGHDRFFLWAGYQPAARNRGSVLYSLAQQPEFPSFVSASDVTMMVWDTLNPTKDEPETLALNLTRSGYNVVIAHSDYVYLDCGASGWVKPGGYWCQPYAEWYTIYRYMQDARAKFSDDEWSKVQGSQVLSWSEGADEWNTELRLWPRAAALAEALWSDPTSTWYDAAPRLMRFRSRLAEAKIPSKPMQPTFCEQGPPNGCNLKPSALMEAETVV